MRDAGKTVQIAALKQASLLILAFSLIGSYPVWADEGASPRDSLKVPTKKMYEQMLDLSKDGNFSEINRLVSEMSPVLNYLREKYQYNAVEAINQGCDRKDSDLVRSAVHGAVFRDVRALLDEAESHSGSSLRKAQTDIRIARLTYEIVSTSVRKSDMTRDERIKKFFVDAFRLTTTDSPYSKSGELDPTKLVAVLDKISSEIKDATPAN